MTSNEKKLRVAVIGAGNMAVERHIPALLKRSDVVLDSICRLGSEELDLIRSHFEIPFASESYKDVLERNLDAVVVSSPHDLHHEHAKAALQRGLHVLCEKPLTLAPAHAWELVELAEERRLHLVVSNGWNYNPPFSIARELLLGGAIGTIQFAVCNMASASHSTFAGTEGMTQKRQSLVRPQLSTWQDPRRGGGFAYGQVSHSAALLFWLTNLRAVRVQCLMTSPDATVDLYNAAIVRFDGGAIGSVTGNAAIPDDCPFQIDLQIGGSEGTLNFLLKQSVLEVLRYDGRHHRVSIDPETVYHRHDDPLHALLDLVQGGGENKSPGEVGAKTVELIEAMHRSAERDGEAVDIDRRG